MEVLITGFERFSTFRENPSGIISELLDGEEIRGARIKGAVLPVIYEDSLKKLKSLLDDRAWDLVISTGLNPNIGWIALERYAHNIKEAEIPDESGVTAEGEVIMPDGEIALASSLPLRKILFNLRDEGIPSRISYSAGGYLCNSVFYYVLYRIQRHGGRGGFIHLPLHTEYVAGELKHYGKGHMPLKTLLKGVKIAIETTLKEGEKSSV